ncbi:MAG: type I restriction-modification enzyme R subunit C-terminal domain-containing protein [Roseococcus sp.]
MVPGRLEHASMTVWWSVDRARRWVPAIAAQMELILEIQTDAWWQDVTLPMLETARKKLRGLAYLIEKRKRKILYTDFADEIGEGQEIVFERFVSNDEFAKFREKARHFLKAHENHLAVAKLRTNKPLTPMDLTELERMLLEAGTAAEVAKAREESAGLGFFVRSLVGLDRGAAVEAFAAFQTGKAFTANQLQFLNTIIDHLTQSGTVEPSRLYEAPYTKFGAKGVDGVFKGAEVVELIRMLDEIRGRAVA